MKLSDCIDALEACLDQFGDVEVGFTTTSDGNPAVELKNVDTTNKPDVQIDEPDEEEIRRFNIRFPIAQLFIPSPN